MTSHDIGLCSVAEKLKVNGADEDIVEAALSLHRNEISLLLLKRAGVSGELIDACFLLSQCADSLIPERIEELRRNPLAKSIKIGELRALLRDGDACSATQGRWDVCRKSLIHALDILENGARADEPPNKSKVAGILERFAEFYEETEEMHHVALSGRSS